ncbi:hypothetical protein PDIDSM_8825 [Penicillium digitatum]|nr:hypothetical protein PDIDSM_8825 [Penicillium digitatum]
MSSYAAERSDYHLDNPGSGINSHVGATAGTPAPQTNRLDTKRTQNMGIKHFDSTCGRAQRISPGTADNSRHAADVCCIQAIRNPKHSSGQYKLVEAVQALDEAQSQGWQVRFRWIQGHVGVHGNDAVDQTAKDAAKVDLNARANAKLPPEPDSLQTLTATAKSTIHRAMRNE